MGREKKCGTCDWISYKGRSKKIEQQCSVCDDVFPCTADCGHLDCLEYKVPRCFVCCKKVRGPEYNFIAASGTGCYFVHSKCVGDADIAITVTLNEL
jgi:hypothetical protein